MAYGDSGYGGGAFRGFDPRTGARQEAARRAAEERRKAEAASDAGGLQVGGTLLGALIGGIAAPFTGGASIPAGAAAGEAAGGSSILSGMATGAGIGSALGGLGAAAVSPETVDASKAIPGGLSALDKLLNLDEEDEAPGGKKSGGKGKGFFDSINFGP